MLGCASGEDHAPASAPAPVPCELLRDHLVDLRLASVGTPGEPIDIDAHRRAMQAALGDGFVSSCKTNVAQATIDCELAAGSLDAANACDRRR